MKYLLVIFHLLCWGLVTALATCSVMFCIDKDRCILSGIACLLIAFFIAGQLVPIAIKWSRSPLDTPKLSISLLTGLRSVSGLIISLAAVGAFMHKEDLLYGFCFLSFGLVPLSPLDKIIFVRYKSIVPAFSVLPRNRTILVLSGLWWYVAAFFYLGSAFLYEGKLTDSAIACMVMGVVMLLLNPVAYLLNNWKSSSGGQQEQAPFDEPVAEPQPYTEKEKEKEYWQLIRKGESATVEFKSTLRVDVRTGKPEKFIQHSVIKTLAAFLNSQGGTLLIGIDDNKNIIGLENDFNSFSKPDKLDEFQKFLDNLLGNSIGNRFHRYLEVKFPELEEKVICVITIQKKSGRPVYVTNDAGQEVFYIRRLASTIDLKPSEIVKYIQEHWSR